VYSSISLSDAQTRLRVACQRVRRNRHDITPCTKVRNLLRAGPPRNFLRADKSKGLDADSAARSYVTKMISIALEPTLLALLTERSVAHGATLHKILLRHLCYALLSRYPNRNTRKHPRHPAYIFDRWSEQIDYNVLNFAACESIVNSWWEGSAQHPTRFPNPPPQKRLLCFIRMFRLLQ
jgi:hypothetical protein